MKYMRAYKYLFDNEKWLTNLLCCIVCILVPVLGPIVLSGYGYSIVEALHRQKHDKSYPDFDFNRIMDYLMRGLWPFLINLIVGLPVGLLLGALYFVGFLVMMLLSDSRTGPHPLLFFGFFIGYMLLVMVASFLVNLVVLPMMLRAGLSQEFNLSAMFAFMKDFLKRVWKEMMLAMLFLFATAIPLAMIGYALCFVGVYPAAALITMASYYILWQLYEIYLERGGMPVPLKPALGDLDFGASDKQVAGEPGPPNDSIRNPPDDRFGQPSS